MKFTEFTISTTSEASELVADILWQYTTYGVAVCDYKDVIELIERRRETVDYIEETLLGNDCGGRGTSCADQLAKAVRAAHEKENKND